MTDKVNGSAEKEQDYLTPGPPPKYNKAYASKVRKASAVGYTNSELCRLLEVHPDVIQLWSMMYDEFAAALRANTQARTDRVEAALFQRCVGYEYETRSVSVEGDKERRTITRTHYPADPVAAFNWMRTHDPNRYGPETTKAVNELVITGGLPDKAAKED